MFSFINCDYIIGVTQKIKQEEKGMKNDAAGRVLQMEDSSGFPVAVKRWDKNNENACKARWEQEMLSLLQGKGIPKLVRGFEDADYFYVVTEWISGMTLKQYVEVSGGFLSGSEAVSIGTQILSVIERMHKTKGGPYIHTDLSPSNIMIKGKDIYVLDLESVKCGGKEKRFTDEKTVVLGSRPFTAPEVFTGMISPASDYYSLGALLYFMTTGATWDGDSGKVEKDRFGMNLLKLLDPNPEKRKQGLKIFKRQSYRNESEMGMTVPPTASIVEDRDTAMVRTRGGRGIVIYIDNNLHFAAELAHEAAMYLNMKIGLFAVREADIVLAARALGIRNISLPEAKPFSDTGAEMSFYENSKIEDWLEKGYMMQPEGFGNFSLGLITSSQLTPPYDYKNEGECLCHWARTQFDLTVIIGGRSMCYTAVYCDRIIAPVKSNLWEIESTKKMIDDFEDNFGGRFSGYVACDYKEGISLAREKIIGTVGAGAYLGEIYYDGNRYLTENNGHTPYCYLMPETIKEQYKEIIKKILNNNENQEEYYDEY